MRIMRSIIPSGYRMFFLCVSIVVLLVLAETGFACTCTTADLGSAVEMSSNIVVLRLKSVEYYPLTDAPGYTVDNVRQSKLVVEKVFKGSLKVGQELAFAQGGGADCVWTFNSGSIGEDYLFYLSKRDKSDGLWRGFICSRSRPVKYAAADLRYLETIERNKGRTRLFGALSLSTEPAVEGEKGSYNLLAEKKIRIEGNGKNIDLVTDENGVYEIYDLPPGKYILTPENIPGFRFDKESKGSTEVEISSGLEEQNFKFKIDNSIRGRLLDENGKPLSKVCLHLIPAHGEKPPYFYQGACTGNDGAFVFDEIPTGTYLLIANEEGNVTAYKRFGRLYYPGSSERKDAKVIAVGPGDHLENINVHASETAEIVKISGRLLYEDDTPAAKERIQFFDTFESLSQIPEYARAGAIDTTDSEGRFVIQILKGHSGLLVGAMYTFSGEYENCPKLEKLIKLSKGSIPEIFTSAIKLKAESDQVDVELRFPFPSCKKAKID